jgi:hypothetical protein
MIWTFLALSFMASDLTVDTCRIYGDSVLKMAISVNYKKAIQVVPIEKGKLWGGLVVGIKNGDWSIFRLAAAVDYDPIPERLKVDRMRLVDLNNIGVWIRATDHKEFYRLPFMGADSLVVKYEPPESKISVSKRFSIKDVCSFP